MSEIIQRITTASIITAWVAMFVGGIYLSNYGSGWWCFLTIFAIALLPWTDLT